MDRYRTHSRGLALGASALLLWTARRSLIVVIGLVILLLATAGGTFAYTARNGAGQITPSEARSVRLGVTPDALTGQLGGPAGDGKRQRDGVELDCLMYRGREVDPAFSRTYAFCFRSERLAAKESF